MRPSACDERVLGVTEELVDFALLTHDCSNHLDDNERLSGCIQDAVDFRLDHTTAFS